MIMKRAALFLLGFLAGGIVFNAIQGRSAELELELGQCRFGRAHDGTFYDSTMSPRLYLTPRCAELGIADRFSGSPWGWRISLLTTGAVESRDSLAPMNDGYYDPNPCTDEHWANCHSLFGGTGRMQGISFAVTRRYDLGRQWWLQSEYGLIFFKHYFNGYAKPQDFHNDSVLAAGLQTGTSDKWEGGSLNQSSRFPGMPVPRIGARVGWKRLYFAARYSFAPGTLGLPGHDGSSVTDHSHLDLMIGIRISLGQ